MSDINMYDISISVFKGGLHVLIDILKKAASLPGLDDLPSARLIDDMKPLTFHVQSVSNTVSKSLKLLLNSDVIQWEDNETTMEQLITRAENTLELLKGIDPKALEGSETTVVKILSGEVTGKQFIFGLAMPNMFFHLQTTYAILRMKGVPLGKTDYLGPWAGPWNHS
ncbi:hypothetical protein MMC25_004698 [Agyrium rufum]|nr:hypothetical protein [Agyrium rufum]